jgi:hypothetical protein
VKTKTIDITDTMIEEALACLKRAEDDNQYAKQLGGQIKAASSSDLDLGGLRAVFVVWFIPRALASPRGRIAPILRKCGLLDPEFTNSLNYEFLVTQNQAPLPPDRRPRGLSRPRRSA